MLNLKNKTEDNDFDYLDYQSNIDNLKKITEEQAKFDYLENDLDACFGKFSSMLGNNEAPKTTSTYENTFQRQEPQSVPSQPEHYPKPQKDIYEELGLPKLPPAIPKLQSQPYTSYTTPSDSAPKSYIPDYSQIYKPQSSENQNPNMPPFQNQVLRGGHPETYNPDIDSILNPSAAKPLNEAEKPTWRGNITNCNLPSELQFSPINKASEYKESPAAAPRPQAMGDNNIYSSDNASVKLDWNSSGKKSENYDNED